MGYMTVKDLKQTRNLWRQLSAERELVITRDGKPCAILVEVNAESCDESLAEIRRGLFSTAVSRIRRRAASQLITPGEVDAAIAESRKERGLA
jgi:antitoxin (DNA-binding transcriptional repressor) of toxin-antitoxin stability system